MLLAALLAVIVGVALGMLGGGGSILTVPILVYAAKLDPRVAIATSLLVVFATSLVALIPHAQAGHVRWRAAFVFGGAGLLGAFAGGRVAALIPSTWLLMGFAGLMFATAMAMIRGRSQSTCQSNDLSLSRLRLLPMTAWGLLVGVVTGLVGAGGGFVVVPALSLLAGLPMPAAVGTSLLIIALNSAAGFVGHWHDVAIPWGLAAVVSIPAAAASLVGVKLAKRVPEAWLRPLFGWVVLVMALFVLGQQIPADLRNAEVFTNLFVQRWPWWAGGLAIGGLVLALLWSDNKLLGVSTGCAELCSLRRDPQARGSWRVLFVMGIVLGGFVATTLSGASVSFAHGAFDNLFSSSLWIKGPVLIVGGALVGYGARVAGGCTSGHGIVGVAQGARSSLLATTAFMIGGFVTTGLLTLVHG